MKNIAKAAAAYEENSSAVADDILEELPKEVREAFDKFERHEFFSPKYAKVLKKNMAWKTREIMEKTPEMPLKEVVLCQIQKFPDWMPPKLLLEAIQAVMEEWQRCREKEENLTTTGA